MNKKISVFGVGNVGRDALNCMTEAGIEDVEFVNAENDEDSLKNFIGFSNLVFIITSLSLDEDIEITLKIAQIAKNLGVLAIPAVIKPFGLEAGAGRRMNLDKNALEVLKKISGSVLLLETDKILRINPNVNISMKNLSEVYQKVNEILCYSLQGIIDVFTKSGFVNLDFEDIKEFFTASSGVISFGIGEGEGNERAEKAAENAIKYPLLNIPVESAKKILLNVTTGTEIMLSEMADATMVIEETAQPEAEVIWGHVIDEKLGDKVRAILYVAS